MMRIFVSLVSWLNGISWVYFFPLVFSWKIQQVRGLWGETMGKRLGVLSGATHASFPIICSVRIRRFLLRNSHFSKLLWLTVEATHQYMLIFHIFLALLRFLMGLSVFFQQSFSHLPAQVADATDLNASMAPVPRPGVSKRNGWKVVCGGVFFCISGGFHGVLDAFHRLLDGFRA